MNNKQAIDRLVKHLEWGWSPETVEAIKMGIHALEENKWIPCSEKMPEESGFYMASVYCEVTKENRSCMKMCTERLQTPVIRRNSQCRRVIGK